MRFLLLFLLSIIFTSKATALDASVTAATFKSEDGPYFELYFNLIGSSLTGVPVDPADSTGLQTTAVDVLVVIKEGLDIIRADKFRLNSPADSSRVNFIGLKRYGLPNGTYELEITLTDAHDPTDERSISDRVELGYFEDQTQISDIQLLAGLENSGEMGNPLVKNGIYFEPLPFQFYHRDLDRLHLYLEIYNTDRTIGEDYLLHLTVMDTDLRGSDPVVDLYRRVKPEAVVPFVYSLDIDRLRSGNYQLRAEVMNRDKEVFAERSTYFQRSNPDYVPEAVVVQNGGVDIRNTFVGKLTAEELRYALKALKPKILPRDGETVNLIIRDENTEAQRNYLYSYFASTAPQDPEAAFNRYMEVAEAVDNQYANGFGYGFETDRGNIFLKYGRPDDQIAIENDPYAPPYEIWVYYDFPVTNQTNVKFLFYNPSLAANGHILLHSTARTELQNPRWEVVLYDAPGEIDGNQQEGTTMQDGYLRNARTYWEDW